MSDTSTQGPDPLFVDVKRAAAMLSVGPGVVYDLLDKRVLDGARQGVKRLVSVASLRQYAQDLIDAEKVGAAQ